MTDSNSSPGARPETTPDDLELAQTSSADVESAGRSCLVIIALAVIILILLAIWVLYTTA